MGILWGKEPENEARAEKLTRLGREAVKNFEPKEGTTFCNLAVHFICENFGFHGFKNMTANQIVYRMKNAPDFAEVSTEAAQKLANDGRIVIAGFQNEPNGHVAVCQPGTMIYSGNWREKAPMIANVGKRNGIMSANYAFIKKPQFWAWVEMTA